MKTYSITVNASPRYPIRKTYQVEATSWAAAISRAVRQYFKEHKCMRTTTCYVTANNLGKKLTDDDIKGGGEQ